MAAESTSYRNLQKSFTSNLNGTTAFEISLVTSSAPVSVLLRSLLWQFLAGNRQTLEGIFPTRWLNILSIVCFELSILYKYQYGCHQKRLLYI